MMVVVVVVVKADSDEYPSINYLQVISLMRYSWRRRRNTMDLGSKKANSGISMNAYNTTVTSRYQMSMKASPSRGGIISCLKLDNSDATDVWWCHQLCHKWRHKQTKSSLSAADVRVSSECEYTDLLSELLLKTYAEFIYGILIQHYFKWAEKNCLIRSMSNGKQCYGCSVLEL